MGWLSNYNKTPLSKEGRCGTYQFIVSALVLADPFPDKNLNADPDTDQDPDHRKMFKNLLEIYPVVIKQPGLHPLLSVPHVYIVMSYPSLCVCVMICFYTVYSMYDMYVCTGMYIYMYIYR